MKTTSVNLKTEKGIIFNANKLLILPIIRSIGFGSFEEHEGKI